MCIYFNLQKDCELPVYLYFRDEETEAEGGQTTAQGYTTSK